MLTLMRKLLRSKIFGGLVFGIVILGMAVWGIEDIFSGGLGGKVVKAGDRGVTISQLNERFERHLNNLRDQTNEPITRETALQAGQLEQVVAQEGARVIALGYARRLGADASDEALIEAVRNEFPAFRDPATGQFDLQSYRVALANNRVNQRDFEQDVRDNLTLGYVIDGVGAAITAPRSMARLQAALQGEVRQVRWFTVPADRIPDPADPTEEEARAYFNENQESFREPERRGLTVLALSPSRFAEDVEIAEEAIVEAYEAQKTTRYAGPEQRRFTEVIFASEEAARAALGPLAAGGDPLALAGVLATDQKTLRATDVFDEDRAATLFNRAALTSSVLGPFEEPGGWSMMRLDEIIPGEPRPLDDALRLEIRNELALTEGNATFYEAVNQLDDLIGEGLDLIGIGDRLGISASKFWPIDRRGIDADGVTVEALTDFRVGIAEAFDLFEGDTTNRIDATEQTYLIRVDEVLPTRIPEYEDIQDALLTQLKAQRQVDALRLAGDAIKAAITEGNSDLEAQAALFEAEVQTPTGELSRINLEVGVPRSMLGEVFSAQPGDVVYAPSPEGGLTVLQLDAVIPPDAAASDALVPVASLQLAQALELDIGAAFDQEMREFMKLELDEGALAQYRNQILNQQ